ncbi:MAG: hypothetical protein AAGE59_09470 [Cyanobacteria bacterium P01_F01_bin.86]
MKIFGVTLTVLLTFLTSIVLDYSAKNLTLSSLIGISIILAVFAINLVKFAAWGWLNKHYDLSKTYPLTAMFFPLIFVYAAVNDQSVITLQKLVGLIIILTGLYFFNQGSREK